MVETAPIPAVDKVEFSVQKQHHEATNSRFESPAYLMTDATFKSKNAIEPTLASDSETSDNKPSMKMFLGNVERASAKKGEAVTVTTDVEVAVT